MMRDGETEEEFCPMPEIVRDALLEEIYPKFLFRYKRTRTPDDEDLKYGQLVYARSPAEFAFQLDADRRLADKISIDLGEAYGENRWEEVDVGGVRRNDPRRQQQQQSDVFEFTDQFLHAGIPVAAHYFGIDDYRWCRAIITSVDRTAGKKNPVTVRFVDYGYVQEFEPRHLRMMPIDMVNIPPLAIKGRLKGLDAHEEMSDEAKEHFWDWTKSLCESKCFINFCNYDEAEDEFVVRLFTVQNGTEYRFPMEMRMPKLPTLPSPAPRPPTPPPTPNTSASVSDIDVDLINFMDLPATPDTRIRSRMPFPFVKK